MSVVPASSVKVGTLVDGTLRLTCDIEPGDAQAAFALFAAPGTPMALAALKPARSKPEKPKAEVGELCRWAAIRCTERIFQQWAGAADENDAAEFVRQTCHVESRAELDTNPEAAGLLHSKIRLPYAAWLKKQGVTA